VTVVVIELANGGTGIIWLRFGLLTYDIICYEPKKQKRRPISTISVLSLPSPSK